MEPVGVFFLCSQQPTTFSYFKPDQSILRPPILFFFTIYSHIILVSTLKSFMWPLSFRFLHQNSACISTFPHDCQTRRPVPSP